MTPGHRGAQGQGHVPASEDNDLNVVGVILPSVPFYCKVVNPRENLKPFLLRDKPTAPLAEPWPAVQMWLIHLTCTSPAPTEHTAFVVQEPCAPGAISWFHEHMFLWASMCACIRAFGKHILCTDCGSDTALGERDIKTNNTVL